MRIMYSGTTDVLKEASERRSSEERRRSFALQEVRRKLLRFPCPLQGTVVRSRPIHVSTSLTVKGASYVFAGQIAENLTLKST